MNKTDYEEIMKKEGDFKIWLHNGMLCMIRRHPSFNHLCGYVAVTKKHPLFNKTYDNITSHVHGGLTFAGTWNSKNLWWFGFDCAHAGDLVFYEGCKPYEDDVYRDMEYVTKETERLARWLKTK